MTIKFACPHCQKSLSVKDHLAGKRAACPSCKKIIAIPAPTASPADMENFAASALTEAPRPSVPGPKSRTLDFACPFCDHPLHLSVDLAGKQTPCPECRRIIKAPQLQKADPKDWRKGDANLPSGARRDTEPPPEGAWGSTTSTGVVSRESLLDAEAIPEVREPLTTGQRIWRWSAVAVSLLIIALGAWGSWSLWSRNRQDRVLNQALESVAEYKTKETALTAAAVYLGAGEYALRSGKRDSAATANTRFRQARDLCISYGPALDRDLLLLHLAVLQTELGSADQEEIATGLKLSWRDALKSLSQTLQNIVSSQVRLFAIQEIGRSLIAKDQVQGAVSLANQMGATAQRTSPRGSGANTEGNSAEGAELLARLGLELVQAKQSDQAKRIAEQLLKAYPEALERDKKKSNRPPITSSLVALCIVLDLPEPKPGHASEDPDNLLLGRIEGLALRGRIDQARSSAAGIKSPILRWRAFVALASAACTYDSPSSTDLDAACQLLDGELKDRVVPSWTVAQLAELALRAKQWDQAAKIAAAIGDVGLRGWVQCDVLRRQLAASTATADTNVVKAVDAKSFSHVLAYEVLAHHNARYDSNTASTVGSWDEQFRPLGYIGAALGLQDASR